MPRSTFRLLLLALASVAMLAAMPACTAVVVDPAVSRPAPAPQPVIVVPGQTYYKRGYGRHYQGPSRQRVNRRLAVCNTNYNNCMANCNAFTNPSQRALCVSQCNASAQQCRAQSTQ